MPSEPMNLVDMAPCDCTAYTAASWPFHGNCKTCGLHIASYREYGICPNDQHDATIQFKAYKPPPTPVATPEPEPPSPPPPSPQELLQSWRAELAARVLVSLVSIPGDIEQRAGENSAQAHARFAVETTDHLIALLRTPSSVPE